MRRLYKARFVQSVFSLTNLNEIYTIERINQMLPNQNRIEKLTNLILKKDKTAAAQILGECMSQSSLLEHLGDLYAKADFPKETSRALYRDSIVLVEVVYRVTKTVLDEIEKDSPIIKPTSGPMKVI
jgi:hypothetical protein